MGYGGLKGVESARMAIGDSKQLFSFEEGVTYLDHGAFGVTPKEVQRVSAQWRERVEAAPRPFFEADHRPRWREVAAMVARRFSASAEDLALVDNVTDGVNAVLRSLSFAPGDEILITSMTYGAVANAARRIAAGQGARVIEARIPYPAPRPELCVEAIRAAITPRTRLAVLDHITSPTALVLPVAEMARVCRERGVAALVDGAHVPGVVPLDIGAIGADWYVANLHKWHFAPRACGFLWARRDRRERLAPTILSWDIDRPFPHSFEWTGTRDPSPWLSIPAAFAFMDRFGEADVRRHNHDLAAEGARILASAWGVAHDAPDTMIGAMALVPLPDSSSFAATLEGREHVQRALWEAHRIACTCMLFEGRLHLRVCAQIYNSAEDYEKLGCAVDGMRA
jgi:isopenicillin-N epimerase